MSANGWIKIPQQRSPRHRRHLGAFVTATVLVDELLGIRTLL